jgi:hypothetical protein
MFKHAYKNFHTCHVAICLLNICDINDVLKDPINFVVTDENIANIFTKDLPAPMVAALCRAIGFVSHKEALLTTGVSGQKNIISVYGKNIFI